MRMQRCHFCILLDNPTGVYFAGQTVTGTVHFQTGGSTQLGGVNLEAKGEARVHWTETRIQTTGQIKGQPELIHYSSEEHYFRQRLALLHHDGEMLELAAGSYDYPFSFKLPASLPSSFEGKYGHVRYTIKATVDRPADEHFETKRIITINSLVDLNTIPLANESTKGSDSTTICCWCCTSRPISVHTWIDKMGYVPGQSVLFSAEVENLSRRTVLGSKVQLIQYTRYHAGGKTRIVERVLTEVQRGPFKGSESWDHVAIAIPPVPPSNLPKCDIISVDYRLELTVRVGKFSSDLKVPLNILIGNIPLRCFYMFLPSSEPIDWTTFQKHQHPDFPPPIFEESAFKGYVREEEDSEHTNCADVAEYAPRYLTYQIN